ncbi:MAG: nitroreductase family protein [Cyclobacteriaceae bacterium]|nr:MAG: nitroreductase family protein [Cyclobacteriaceae bacterium]
MNSSETKTINGFPFVRHVTETFSEQEVINRSKSFYQWMNQRRTVRDFSNKPIPKEVIDNLILTASSAPSGAHKQPWTFCVVENPEMKRKIREAAEQEEYESYTGRMSEEWLDDIKALQTDWHKPFLEIAPYLIVVFKKAYDLKEDGTKGTNYYVNESVGLACGFLLAAIHLAGLVALTHTPSPMNFLTKILNRPENERPFLLIPVGYPATETFVPKLERKALQDVAVYY